MTDGLRSFLAAFSMIILIGGPAVALLAAAVVPELTIGERIALSLRMSIFAISVGGVLRLLVSIDERLEQLVEKR